MLKILFKEHIKIIQIEAYNINFLTFLLFQMSLYKYGVQNQNKNFKVMPRIELE